MYTVSNSVNLVDPNDPEVKGKALRLLLWLGIVSMIMVFAGLTSAYIVRQGEGKWAEFDLPGLFTLSSVIIIVSSLTMQWAISSIRKNDVAKLRAGLLLTLILGFGFVASQYFAWSELYRGGIVFTGHISDIKTDFKYIPSGNETLEQASGVGNVAGSFLYVLTGLHLLHVVAGLVSLIVVFSLAVRKKYTASEYTGVRMSAIFWHFLGGLWLYLFLFLLYIR